MGIFDRIFGRTKTSTPPTAPPPPSHRADPAEVKFKITRLASDGRRGVAGEYYHRKDIAAFVGRRRPASVGDWDAGLRTPAYLLREPKNRYDHNAVQVMLPHAGATVLAGYLSADEAPRWQPLLQRIESAGRIAECSAAIYRNNRGDGYDVVLRLSDPEDAEFANAEPDDATFLSADRQCAVTGEKDHQDVLLPYLHRLGHVWATLHPTTVSSGKYSGSSTIEVRVDDKPVGSLTAVQGERYAEVFGYGEVVASEARVYEGANYLEVQLMLPKVD